MLHHVKPKYNIDIANICQSTKTAKEKLSLFQQYLQQHLEMITQLCDRKKNHQQNLSTSSDNSSNPHSFYNSSPEATKLRSYRTKLHGDTVNLSQQSIATLDELHAEISKNIPLIQAEIDKLQQQIDCQSILVLISQLTPLLLQSAANHSAIAHNSPKS